MSKWLIKIPQAWSYIPHWFQQALEQMKWALTKSFQFHAHHDCCCKRNVSYYFEEIITKSEKHHLSLKPYINVCKHQLPLYFFLCTLEARRTEPNVLNVKGLDAFTEIGPQLWSNFAEAGVKEIINAHKATERWSSMPISNSLHSNSQWTSNRFEKYD